MAFIEWDDSYNLGVHRMDEQHVMLVNIVNNFYDKIEEGDSKENLSSLVWGLRHYSMLHFTEEEEFMVQFNFSNYANHKSEHEMFTSKVAVIEEKLARGETVLSYEIMMFLRQWLLTHINGSDKEYGDLFRENGLM